MLRLDNFIEHWKVLAGYESNQLPIDKLKTDSDLDRNIFDITRVEYGLNFLSMTYFQM